MLEITGDSYDSYGNRDFFYGILKSFGNTSVSLDIPTKPFNDTSLVVTTKQATTSAIVISLVIPVILLVFGTVIWVRRKCK